MRYIALLLSIVVLFYVGIAVAAGTPAPEVMSRIHNLADVVTSRNPAGLECYHTGGGKPVTGRILTYYEPGTLQSEIPVVDGLRHGIARIYHSKTGFLYRETPYVAGRIVGIARTWYDTGEPNAVSAPYVNGKRDGICRGWFRTGKLSYEIVYRDGKQHGPAVEYHENGRLKKKAIFSHGMVTGTWEAYADDGTVLRTWQHDGSQGPNAQTSDWPR